MIKWQQSDQPNGLGWISECRNYAIRQCVYQDGTPTDYWPYYKVNPEDQKYMHVHNGVTSSFEEAARICKEHDQYRHECEVRDWIRRGYTTREKLKELGETLQAKRGRPAALRVYRDIVAILKGEKPQTP